MNGIGAPCQGKTEVLDKLLRQYHFEHHKSHVDCAMIEPRQTS